MTLNERYVFIASPSDLTAERQAFIKIIDQVNKRKAHALGIHLVSCSYETALPGLDFSSQGIIDKEVDKCQIFVMLLWHKWGTPTKTHSSGTYEEYCKAREAANASNNQKPHILLYFRKPDEHLVLGPDEQFRQVQDFKKGIEKEGELLYTRYETPHEWEKLFEDHLHAWLDNRLPSRSAIPTPTSDADTKAALASIAKELAEVKQRLAVVEEKEQHATTEKEREKERAEAAEQQKKARALELAEEAWDAAQNGALTEAEEKFALALKDYESSRILNLHGHYLLQIGDLKGAEAAYRKALTISLAANNKEGITVAYGNLGIVHATRGDLDKAQEMHEKALQLDRELGSKEGMAQDYGNLGNVHSTRGDLDKAQEMYEKALNLNKELGRREGMANQYGNLGIVHSKRGDLDKAEKMYEKSLELAREMGNKEVMAALYGNLGIVHEKRGNLVKAEKMHEKALQLDKELGNKEGMAQDYGNLGNVHSTRGDLVKAEQAWEKALNLYKEVGIPHMVAKVEKLLSDLRKPE
jgi:tetratricopeptide (TPR) repeat protein